MTASSMRSCRRFSWLAVLALAIALAAAFSAAAVRADGIEVRKAALVATDSGPVLEAQFDISLTHALQEALNKGVPLYFLLEFELIRPRWYWFDARVADYRQAYRLSYSALARQYRVAVGRLYQNFTTLSEALAFLSRVRVGDVIALGALDKGTSYVAALRMQLDTSRLPSPFQVTALGSREWNLDSDWYRWTIAP